MLTTRRRALLWAGAAAASATSAGLLLRSCKRRQGTSASSRGELVIREWVFHDERGLPRHCVVLWPAWASGQRLPLLVALHGRGETVSTDVGAHAWLDRYALDEAFFALHRPPLTTAAFRGFVRPQRLAQLNESLRRRPFEGLVVACPSLPSDIGGSNYDSYASWLASDLLPRLRAEAPVLGTAATTGIDGVSLGGISALRMGLARPDLFGAIGALQPAILDAPPEGYVVDSVVRKLGARPLRLVTSDDDVYRDAIVRASEQLKVHNVAHELLVTPGPHGYIWNQGPGALELLLWHDRVLRGQPSE